MVLCGEASGVRELRDISFPQLKALNGRSLVQVLWSTEYHQ